MMTGGIGVIAEERARQIEVEGWTGDHDAEHVNGELAKAAAAYAYQASQAPMREPPEIWPFERSWWKPAPGVGIADRIRNLAKAGALIAAEIDRLQRAAG